MVQRQSGGQRNGSTTYHSVHHLPVGDGLQINFANALRGIADVKPMMYIAFIAYFLISLPAGYFFGFIMDWGIIGIWMAFPFGLTTAGILYYLRFNRDTK